MDLPDVLVLDTDAAVLHMRGNSAAVAALSQAQVLILPLTAQAELLLGREVSRQPERTQTELDEFLPLTNLFFPDEATAAVYARITAQLRRDGRPIPVNDVWNAAVAMQLDLPLAARDEHFEFVDGLKLFHL